MVDAHYGTVVFQDVIRNDVYIKIKISKRNERVFRAISQQ